MSNVSLRNIRKVYDKNVVIDGVDLEIKDKEFIVLVGASGCGKSTILRMVAGLEDISDGEIYIGDKKVNDVHPKDRDIAFVFQSYALYPHMTVRENIAFGLKMRKVDKTTIDTPKDVTLTAKGIASIQNQSVVNGANVTVNGATRGQVVNSTVNAAQDVNLTGSTMAWTENSKLNADNKINEL